jgi:SanA protein
MSTGGPTHAVGRPLSSVWSLLRLLILLLTGFVVLSALALLVANLFVVRSAMGHRADGVDHAPAAPFAVVLGARVFADGRPSAVLADRLEIAVRLYEAGLVQTLLLSGDGSVAPSQVDAMGRWAQQRGVPEEALLLDGQGYDTLATMLRARDVFGVKSALVVTQDFHLDRSVYTARALGIEAVGVPSDLRTYARESRFRQREWLARGKAFLELEMLGAADR